MAILRITNIDQMARELSAKVFDENNKKFHFVIEVKTVMNTLSIVLDIYKSIEVDHNIKVVYCNCKLKNQRTGDFIHSVSGKLYLTNVLGEVVLRSSAIRLVRSYLNAINDGESKTCADSFLEGTQYINLQSFNL